LAGGTGAGIANDGTLTLIGCTFSDNQAVGRGGGIASGSEGTASISNCTLFHNTTARDGGGIAILSGTATLTNCTLSGNIALGSGGGIENTDTLTMANSIVAKNSAGAFGPDVDGFFSSLGFNFVGDDSEVINGFPAMGDQVGTDTNPIDPLLGQLQDNGGPTQTMALLPCSPAIDAGSNALAVDDHGNPLTADQRGFDRYVNGRVDIGAFEFSPVFLSPTDNVLYVTGSNPGDTITISNAPNDFFDRTGVLVVTVNGIESDFLWSDASGGINVDICRGGVSVNIENVSEGTPVAVTTHGGDNVIEVSPAAQSLDSFDGSLNIDSLDGNDLLRISDQNGASPFGRTYNLENDSFTIDDLPGVSISYTNIARIELSTAGGGDLFTNTINVQGEVVSSSLAIYGSDANDNLSVDFSAGNPIPPHGLFFDGGGGTNSATLNANPFVYETYTAAGPASGFIDLNDGDEPLSPTFAITYSNLDTLNDLSQPSSLLVNHLTFNATEAADVINVVDGPVVNGLVTTQINSGGTFATLDFANRNDVTVNTLNGADVVTLNNPHPEVELVDLTVTGGARFLVDSTPAGILTTINSTGGGDVIDVNATGGELDINLAGSGSPTVNISPTAQNLNTIRGNVNVQGMGVGTLIFDDQNGQSIFPYSLDASSLTRFYLEPTSFGELPFQVTISYGQLAAVTLNGSRLLGNLYEVGDTAGNTTTMLNTGSGGDEVDTEATTGPLIVKLTAYGNPVLNISPTAQNLDTIQGKVTVTGQCVAGQCFGTVNLEDQQAAAGRSYTLTVSNLAWGGASSVDFSNIAALILNGTAFNDTVKVRSLPANSVTLHGGGGSNNTLIGTDGDNTWLLAQPTGEEGTLDNTLVFDSFGSLIGGKKRDRFVVPDGAYIPEFLSGGDGAIGGDNNTLDLSGYTNPLTEHIMTTAYGGNVTSMSGGNVTSVVRAFALCQNVIGGQSDDHFIFDQGFGLTTVDGGGGKNNTLDFSPYSLGSLVFGILGHNSGRVSGVIGAFSNIQNLIGGQTPDRFGFRGTAYLDGTIDGQGGSNSLEYTEATVSVIVNLQAGLASGVNFQGGSTPQPGGFSNFQNFVGSQTAPSTLIAPDANNKWIINGANTGTLNSVDTFTGFQKLIGGAASDTFFFQQGGSVTGTVDGTGGTNALDYSQYTGNIIVDLALNLASLVNEGAANSVFNIANVTGSAGNDLLVGDANPNVLIGGTGRNILIGGAGSDTLDASRATSDNILIGGTTDFDMKIAALNAIFAEWTRTDLGFHDRYSDLTTGRNGTGVPALNGTTLLTPATNPTSSNGSVHADMSPDSLTGSNQIDLATSRRVHNWFFVDTDDMLINFLNASDHMTKVK
jgi:hypothetical protein